MKNKTCENCKWFQIDESGYPDNCCLNPEKAERSKSDLACKYYEKQNKQKLPQNEQTS